MNIKQNSLSYIGGIFFLIGLILILISWHFTYPISMPGLDELAFNQFYPTIWLGILLSIIGLFLAGFYSKRKIIQFGCIAFFPLILTSYTYFFYYIPTSDSAGVKGMFEIFHQASTNTAIEPYFQFPTYFTLNEVTAQTLGLNATAIAIIFYALFGILIAIYLFLYLRKITEKNSYHIAFLAVLLYFTGIFFNLNYQWVPQTLAFIFFILLLNLFNKNKIEYKILSMIIFIALAFTHLFIPIIFLFFLGFYSLKEKDYRNMFLLMSCIYVAALVYNATFYLPVIIDAFSSSTFGFGAEYSVRVSQSFMETEGLFSQILSLVNRIRIPLTWIIVAFGFFILWIKKKINFEAFTLGLIAGSYLIAGFLFPVLGTRSLQILLIPLVIGISYYFSKWKKPILIIITLLLLISIAGPMRESYDPYLYQVEEEEHACNFIVNSMHVEKPIQFAIGGINSGYFERKYNFINTDNNNSDLLWMLVPRNPEFFELINNTIDEDTIVLYNPNLGREMKLYGINNEQVKTINDSLSDYNKIYSFGKTKVIVGR